MIIIVAYFRTQVVKFVFCGRDSGQKEWKMGPVVFLMSRPGENRLRLRL